MRGARGTDSGPARPSRPRYWFPLLLFGALTALSLPLSALFSPRQQTGSAVFTREVYPTVTQAMYLGGGASSGPFPFPLGWYWVGVLLAGSLLTAAWYRQGDGRAGSRTPLRGYLATGLVLTVAAAALPALAWGARMDGPNLSAWTWLNVSWQLGTFAMFAVLLGLCILAWISRSRGLAVTALFYAAAVGLAGWYDVHQAVAVLTFYPFDDAAAILPAAVLLLAGLSALAVTGLRALRSPGLAGRT